MDHQSAGPRSLKAEVRGRVQGVGFRYFCMREAARLNLTGWVRNMSDGSVQSMATGSVSDLKEYVSALERGPRMAYVESVNVEWLTDPVAGSGFTVR